MTYAFTFDSSACSGCKACQVACKDKNNLPTGVLWRRVYEVSGGSWTNVGVDDVCPGVWQTNVFAYNLSIACNHCVHPKCAGVCPVDAYVVREDGIVYIDESKCMGCGYCSWACPYSAPRFNPELGHMTKCNFCHDNIDAGLPPACVAACPMRVLDFAEVTIEKLREINGQMLWAVSGMEHPFPLPTFSRTEPHLAVKQHAGMSNGLEKAISNWEEIKPRSKNLHLDELPLIAFTLLGQMAAGITFFSLLVAPNSFLLLSIGILLALAGLSSFLHLGTKKNAWRGIMHLKKSWLSREILMVGLFGASWLVSYGEHLLLKTHFSLRISAFLGLALVYSMSQVYRFKAAPTWNTWRTEAAFFLSAGILGSLAVDLNLAYPICAALLIVELILAASAIHPTHETVRKWRVGLILVAIAGAGAMLLAPDFAGMWPRIPLFLIVLSQEVTGRWLFYESRQPVL